MTIKHSLLAATLALSGLAMAQDNYPSKAITLTVPNPPGGVVDTSARLLNEPLARVIGQPVVIGRSCRTPPTRMNTGVAPIPRGGQSLENRQIRI